MDQGQFQQLLQQLQQGLQPLAQPRPAGAFALTPGQTNAANPIDYTTSTGIKLWQEATAALTFQFSAESREVNQFCEKLSERAHKSGWRAAGANVIDIPDAHGNNHDLINEYGQLTDEQIRNHCATYIANDTRQAQNNAQLYHCIQNTLTKEGQLKILAERDKYHINHVPCGPLLFKLLMQKAIIDTRATASLFRDNLSSLDTYIVTVNSNITDFNDYVKRNYEGLRARGERCDDIMTNLFKGYRCASDKEFVRYIAQKKDAYDDGEDMTPEQLMTLALNKYEILTRQDIWNAKSAEEEKIIALSAELQKIKDTNLKLAKAIKFGGKSQGKANKGATQQQQQGKGKSKGKQKSKNNDKWAWKKIPPKDGESNMKTVNNTIYHWCKYHQAWVVHTPEGKGPDGCRLRQQLEKEEQGKGQRNESALATTLSSILTDIKEDDE
jgi:hypothetical protein